MSVRLTLPYGCLVPDNRRFLHGKGYVLTQRYRQGKEAAHMMAAAQVRARPTYPDEDVWMVLKFWMPDARRRDPSNLIKITQDALEGVCYTDDKQISGLSWLKHGIDRDNPRVEIIVGTGYMEGQHE